MPAALVLVDAAWTAGVLPINVTDLSANLLAYLGRKDLLGPTGPTCRGRTCRARLIRPGTVRLAPGHTSTEDEIDQTVQAPARFGRRRWLTSQSGRALAPVVLATRD